MKKIEKLKIDELSTRFVLLTEDEIAEIMGGWYCFSYCMNFLGQDGDRFESYYEKMYGSVKENQGVSNWYIEGTLDAAGIRYNNYAGSQLEDIRINGRQIISINDNTHAVIYKGVFRNEQGNLVVHYYDPQTGEKNTYTYSEREENNGFSLIGF